MIIEVVGALIHDAHGRLLTALGRRDGISLA
jgi:hypothetical protein